MIFILCFLTTLLSNGHAKNSLVREFESLEALYSPEHHNGLLRVDPKLRKLRFSSFLQAKKEIDAINKDPTIKYTAALNKFSILTKEERQMYLGYNMSQVSPPKEEEDPFNVAAEERRKSTFPSNLPKTGFPDSLDWSPHLPPAKDQGMCASCWAFAFLAALEGAYYVATGETHSMAEQEILDCTPNGCDKGGVYPVPARYIMEQQRIGFSEEIPYTAVHNEICRFKDRKKNVLTKAKLTNAGGFYGSDLSLLRLVNYAVVAATMSMHSSVIHYRGGLYEEPYPMYPPRHAVVVVGYGKMEHGRYWKVGGRYCYMIEFY